MSGVSEMSSNDTATSDVLTSVSNVATAVSTVTSCIAPSGLKWGLCHRNRATGYPITWIRISSREA
ncbi:hypothetical protein DD237_002342 [Peronospora effusa]|uniref:Uncharacterized protein n=1 Tax=Peronospora effusa TaxID=542832 RepID=A0A425CG74_9STRA|nr:hypothetical protein DD237_002342 [Peronospora effusa]